VTAYFDFNSEEASIPSEHFAELVVSYRVGGLESVITHFTGIIGAYVFVALLMFVMFLLYLNKLLGVKISRYVQELGIAILDKSARRSERLSLLGHERLIDVSIVSLHNELEKIQKKRIEEQGRVTLGLLASQVSHDIRSPLASLQAIVHNASGLDEESRIQVRTAVNRISDIANNLLSQNRLEKLKESDAGVVGRLSSEPRTPQLLSAVIESCVSEKRAQFGERKNLEIHFNVSGEAQGVFSDIQLVELSRMLSNLINNSIEAFEDGGGVEVGLSSSGTEALISIKDNGKGIPPEFLKKIGEWGFTFGKKDGNGLGLSHAKATVESWGGSFEIESKVGAGTTVNVRVPVSEVPGWFASSIPLAGKTTVVVIDDDPSIHQIWDQRLKDTSGVTIVHLHSGKEMVEWYGRNPLIEDVHYLCDYEFKGEQETGLELVEMLNIANQATLVTSRWSEREVQDRCEKLGLKLLPKSMAGGVGVERLKSA